MVLDLVKLAIITNCHIWPVVEKLVTLATRAGCTSRSLPFVGSTSVVFSCSSSVRAQHVLPSPFLGSGHKRLVSESVICLPGPSLLIVLSPQLLSCVGEERSRNPCSPYFGPQHLPAGRKSKLLSELFVDLHPKEYLPGVQNTIYSLFNL